MTFTSAPVTGTGPSSNDAKEILISMKTTEKWRKVASQWCYFQLSFTFYFEQCKNLCYKKRNWSQEELVTGYFGAFHFSSLIWLNIIKNAGAQATRKGTAIRNVQMKIKTSLQYPMRLKVSFVKKLMISLHKTNLWSHWSLQCHLHFLLLISNCCALFQIPVGDFVVTLVIINIPFCRSDSSVVSALILA